MSKGNYRCAQCDDETLFSTQTQFIAHFRKEHGADNAYFLWDAIGTTGDPFADSVITTVQLAAQSNAEKHRELDSKFMKLEKEHRDLGKMYNNVVRRLNIIALAIQDEAK